MKKLLICVDWFYPGYKAGGIVRSCTNLVFSLQHDYEIYVLTRNTDINETIAYRNIESDRWIRVERFNVFYCSKRRLTYNNFRLQIVKIRPDVIYLNSVFSTQFTVTPLIVCKLANLQARVVLAPRGMLKSSALKYKTLKKHLFLSAFKILKLNKGLVFHATDSNEVREVTQIFGSSNAILEVGDFPGRQNCFEPPLGKRPGEAALIFIGKIHPIKNLDYLLKVLLKIDANIKLTIIGGISDNSYWMSCRNIINSFNDNISVQYLGDLDHKAVMEQIRSHHLLVLPSTGENFGHVIFESLSQGRPVLISDQTPWKNLQSFRAGWEFSLDDNHKFASVINAISMMPFHELSAMCLNTWQFCRAWLQNSDLKSSYNELFGA